MNATRRRILEHLARATERVYGLDLIEAKVASRFSLYVHMARLEESGFVEGVEERITLQRDRKHGRDLFGSFVEGVEERVTLRRSYKITDKGCAVLLPEARAR